MVISNGHVSGGGPRPFADDVVRPCRRANTEEVGAVLISIAHDEYHRDLPAIDAAAWNDGVFRPIPPIIDAAVMLYSKNEVFEIGHASAAREDLDKAIESLTSVVRDAKDTGSKAICFVTGVPGSGKTLVGLNAVHHPEIRDTAAFLSGNGPLIKILREALIRDEVRRLLLLGKKEARSAAKTSVQAFIQSVHRFAEIHYQGNAPAPAEKVIIFDEAQRAWDAKQNNTKKKLLVSEAHMMLQVMSRREGWAVLICLVGGGQEIHSGEAGLSEWGVALKNFRDWKVFASPEILRDKTGGPYSLFTADEQTSEQVVTVDDFHLKINHRSVRANEISTWVDAVLRGDDSSGRKNIAASLSRPMLTRDLSMARQWLKEKRRGLTRAGLVASSRAIRLRPDGIETSSGFRQQFEWERWFLDRDSCEEAGCDHKYCKDVRASSKLEVAATEFEIQGLELDWVGVCWGEDLLWNGKEWGTNNFTGKKWLPNKNPQKHIYRVNSYRVLFTRARQGMIMYVPNPDRSDSSRLHDKLDLTAEFLIKCGAVPL